MTTESVHGGYTAPILLLALGDVRSADDGIGPALLADLAERYRYDVGFVEFVDGGTQGLELLSRIAGRQALVPSLHPGPTALRIARQKLAKATPAKF